MRQFRYRPPAPDHRAVADRWAAQYRSGKTVWWPCNDPRGSASIHAELVDLVDGYPPAPTEAQRAALITEIDRIIGNDSWTR